MRGFAAGWLLLRDGPFQAPDWFTLRTRSRGGGMILLALLAGADAGFDVFLE